MEDEAAAGDTYSGNTDGEGERLPKPSLFPLFHLGDAPAPAGGKPPDAQNPLWLRNASFTVDVASLPTHAQTSGVPLSESGDSSSGEDGVPAEAKRPAYELVASTSGSEDGAARGKRRRKRRKRGRERDVESDAGLGRKSGVEKWAGRSDAHGDKGYYFDGKGDRDNLAFGSIYRMDVARYKSHHATMASGLYPRVVGLKRNKSLMDADEDVDSVDHKLRDNGRYYSAKYVTLDRMKDLKRLRIHGGNKVFIFPGDFVPLNEVEALGEHADGPSDKMEREESWEDEVLRKTREFNKISRECPHDEQAWLAFAEFQDKIAARQPQKSARLQTLEKKISILEKAVDLNPKNEELILRLLKAYEGRDSAEVLTERWQRALMQHSGSCTLWKEYIWFCQGDFSKFRVSDIRKGYAYAIQALSSVCLKLSRQIQETTRREVEPTLAQLETGLVDIFVSLCRFEWQSGYQELAAGLFQAQIEYSLFCPSLFLTGQSKQRLFEHFWNSSGSRVGEVGAIGWAMWLEKEEDVRQKNLVENSFQEEDVGGWSGWSESVEKPDATSMDHDGSFEHIPSEEVEEKSGVEDTMVKEEDVETLLKSLGVDVDADVGTDVKDPIIWYKWSEEELARDSEQWLPARATSGVSCNPDAASIEDDAQISRVILFDDISEYIFSLCSEEAKYSLVFQFIDFFGGKISRKISTNSQSWKDYILSLDILPQHFLKDFTKLCRAVTRTESGYDCCELENILGSSGCFLSQTILLNFLRNAILLCLEAFPRNYILQEALLSTKELSTFHTNSFGSTMNPTRQLAKGLLKNDRHDLLLCGVYARNEAACGNVDLARKVFDMALTSIGGLSLDLQKNGPLLHLWYSEMELANIASGNDSALSNARIVHILCCLGSGAKYSPYEISPSNLQILRARQGYKEKIKDIYSSWAHGCIEDSSIALICCAALLDNLTLGLDAGLVILNEAFCMVLPERRRQSPQLESLFYFSVKMLLKNLKASNMSIVWKFLLQGLQIYPYSPKILAAFVKFGCIFTVPNKLRRIIDDYCNRKPSVVITLFALTYELMRCGSQHRIRGLYERALADDKMQKSVLLWRSYLAHEFHLGNFSAARRIYFRAIHACPWSKTLWVDGYKKLYKVLTTKELSDLQEVMRDKELRLRTDIYEILLQEETTI